MVEVGRLYKKKLGARNTYSPEYIYTISIAEDKKNRGFSSVMLFAIEDDPDEEGHRVTCYYDSDIMEYYNKVSDE